MTATGFNHVSVHATNLDESVRFYEDLFGMERIPTYDFGFPVQYLRLGELQLHIFVRETSAPAYHHFGINVDNFEQVYLRAKQMGIHESKTFGHHIYELPDGTVQMYVRDPAGNIVEVDHPDVSTLDLDVISDLKKLDDRVPQTGQALRSSLYNWRLPELAGRG
ncbi:MAG: VOC family protein [Streptosporangiales bacterium]|nr:VOC family protein [Streptosporangiales bacterium]